MFLCFIFKIIFFCDLTLFSLQFRAHAMWVHLFVESFNVLVFIFKIIFFCDLTLFSLQFRAHAMWVHLFVESFNSSFFNIFNFCF